MAELRCDFLKKRHRIAVAWRVKDGGAMAAMADVAARRKMADAAATLDLEAPTQRDNPRPRNHPHLQPATTHGGDEHGSDHPRQRERRRRARRERRQRERRRRPRTQHPHEGERRGAASVWCTFFFAVRHPFLMSTTFFFRFSI